MKLLTKSTSQIVLTHRAVVCIIADAMAKTDDENLIDYVLEVGVQATDAEDAMTRWRKEGVVITVNVGRIRAGRVPPSSAMPPAGREVVMVPQSGGSLPKDVGQQPQKKKR